MDEICVSTRPVPMCEQEYVVKSYKNQKVNFHCVSRNSLEGQRLKQKVENDEVISGRCSRSWRTSSLYRSNFTVSNPSTLSLPPSTLYLSPQK